MAKENLAPSPPPPLNASNMNTYFPSLQPKQLNPTQPIPLACCVQEVELADKTVRAKDNNEKLHAALQAKAKQAERMMVMNQGLAFENRSLKNDLDLAKASEVSGA